MLDKQWEMINNAINLNTIQSVQSVSPMEAICEYCWEWIDPKATKRNIFDASHPEWYHSAANELSTILDTLLSNVQCHIHSFCCRDSNNVIHTACLLRSWNYHPGLAQWLKSMTNAVECLWDVHRVTKSCLDAFHIFLIVVQMMIRTSNSQQQSIVWLTCSMKWSNRGEYIPIVLNKIGA